MTDDDMTQIEVTQAATDYDWVITLFILIPCYFNGAVTTTEFEKKNKTDIDLDKEIIVQTINILFCPSVNI